MVSPSVTDFIAGLRARELIRQVTGDGEFERHVAEGPRTLYCGFDPTADSLHIGHLVPLLMLRRFQQAGHRPIALVGGATGLIGDPSFKAQERSLNTPDVVAGWTERLRSQVSRFIDFDRGQASALVVNNLDWMAQMSVLDFLRDVGKHFSVNAMIHKESVKQRIEREGEGISFTEFSYMLLQSYDFAELNRRYGCTVQVGGSDQWGNIVGGIELTRRSSGHAVHGMTVPLVVKADGTKFGKTESGAVWLDPAKTSPYAFYQFWLNTADADVYRFLRYFTFLDLEEIGRIEAEDLAATGKPQAQGVLAREVTGLVHGEEGLSAALRISSALFSGDIHGLSEGDFIQLRQDGLPASRLHPGNLAERTLSQLLTECGLASSGKQVKDALGNQGLQVNGVVVGGGGNANAAACFSPDRSMLGRYFLVRLGKKKYHLFELEC
ncbi:MAG: tyrosine--tRNA ligase [Spongiibacteraceae bacterium]|jgi:tyrosyl-tRNA synthetase|nr:tyrosine--tRNA ligase [Spongiibacteraceae bacterium]